MASKTGKVLLAAALLGVLAVGWCVFDLFIRVPDFTKLRDSVEVPIRLANGDKASRVMGPRTPNWTPLSGMSEWLPRAVVSSEDGSFYTHKGIDVYEMQEALKKDLKEGRFARGASTITQQVLKNVYLSHLPKVWRKVKEIAWASKLEAALTKPQILAFYLNMAEWGPGIYGVGDASRHYFATSPSNLTARQSAFLAMLLPSPRRYHAFFRQRQLTQWANSRVNRILQVMNKFGQLPEDQYQAAVDEKLWGTSVLSDSAPGAPKDPGWDISENPDELFEGDSGTKVVMPREDTSPVHAPKATPQQASAIPTPAPPTMDPPAALELGGEPSEKKLDSVDTDTLPVPAEAEPIPQD